MSVATTDSGAAAGDQSCHTTAICVLMMLTYISL